MYVTRSSVGLSLFRYWYGIRKYTRRSLIWSLNQALSEQINSSFISANELIQPCAHQTDRRTGAMPLNAFHRLCMEPSVPHSLFVHKILCTPQSFSKQWDKAMEQRVWLVTCFNHYVTVTWRNVNLFFSSNDCKICFFWKTLHAIVYSTYLFHVIMSVPTRVV